MFSFHELYVPFRIRIIKLRHWYERFCVLIKFRCVPLVSKLTLLVPSLRQSSISIFEMFESLRTIGLCYGSVSWSWMWPCCRWLLWNWIKLFYLPSFRAKYHANCTLLDTFINPKILYRRVVVRNRCTCKSSDTIDSRNLSDNECVMRGGFRLHFHFSSNYWHNTMTIKRPADDFTHSDRTHSLLLFVGYYFPHLRKFVMHVVGSAAFFYTFIT